MCHCAGTVKSDVAGENNIVVDSIGLMLDEDDVIKTTLKGSFQRRTGNASSALGRAVRREYNEAIYDLGAYTAFTGLSSHT